MINNTLKFWKETPEDIVKILIENGCRDILTDDFYIEDCLTQYINCVGIEEGKAEVAKVNIVNILSCILNELKEVPVMRMRQYIDNVDRMLNDIIDIGKTRGWLLDKHSALGLCVYIIGGYITDNGKILCDLNSDGTALEQIVGNFSDDVFYDICDPVWERYFDDLIYEYGDEDAVYQYHDVDALRKAVRMRECLPSGYMRM